jgi:hypothetical protein
MDFAIQEFINCKKIAIVGYSRNTRKFGNAAYNELKKRGYEVFPVHPVEKEISGVNCYPNLSALQGKIDSVFISIKPVNVIPVLKEIKALGIKNVWLQKGAESKEVLEEATRLGLNTVAKKCILMYAPPVDSMHRWHRTFTKLFGKL